MYSLIPVFTSTATTMWTDLVTSLALLDMMNTFSVLSNFSNLRKLESVPLSAKRDVNSPKKKMSKLSKLMPKSMAAEN